MEAENGEAFVTLKAGLGSLPPPPPYVRHRPPAYYRRQDRRKVARAAAEQEATPAEQACVESDENNPNEVNSLQNDEEANEIVREKSQEVAEKASKQFECLICDFTSNWENGLKVHMARIHSKIDQIDGHSDQPDDEKYTGSRHYWMLMRLLKKVT